MNRDAGPRVRRRQFNTRFFNSGYNVVRLTVTLVVHHVVDDVALGLSRRIGRPVRRRRGRTIVVGPIRRRDVAVVRVVIETHRAYTSLRADGTFRLLAYEILRARRHGSKKNNERHDTRRES